MAGQDADLESLGIHVIGDDDDPEVRLECMRIAQRLVESGHQVIGLIPTSPQVAIPPLGVQLGMALTELTGSTVAFVDANVRYPGLAGLTRGEATDSDRSVFTTRWLRGSLALLTPPENERPGAAVPQLARFLLDDIDIFSHVLVDLTGFEVLGEHASAAACMDAVMLVGQAHKTRERTLLGFKSEMPKGRFLGVLLVG